MNVDGERTRRECFQPTYKELKPGIEKGEAHTLTPFPAYL